MSSNYGAGAVVGVSVGAAGGCGSVGVSVGAAGGAGVSVGISVGGKGVTLGVRVGNGVGVGRLRVKVTLRSA